MASFFNWSEDAIQTGPCSIWIDVKVPATGSYVDIDEEGRPIHTAPDPQPYHLGYTRTGARITIETAQAPFEADQSQDASRRLAWTVGAMVEASLLQTLQAAFYTTMRRMMPASTVAGETLTFGGAVAPSAETHTSMLVTWLVSDKPAGKAYSYFLLYYGRNVAPQSVFNVTRQDAVSFDIQFRALPLTSRVRTDWFCHFRREPNPTELGGT